MKGQLIAVCSAIRSITRFEPFAREREISPRRRRRNRLPAFEEIPPGKQRTIILHIFFKSRCWHDLARDPCHRLFFTRSGLLRAEDHRPGARPAFRVSLGALCTIRRSPSPKSWPSCTTRTEKSPSPAITSTSASCPLRSARTGSPTHGGFHVSCPDRRSHVVG